MLPPICHPSLPFTDNIRQTAATLFLLILYMRIFKLQEKKKTPVMEIFFFLTYLIPYDLTDLFSYCNRFYFTQNILRKLFYSNAGAGRFACEVFFIDCIAGRS